MNNLNPAERENLIMRVANTIDFRGEWGNYVDTYNGTREHRDMCNALYWRLREMSNEELLNIVEPQAKDEPEMEM